MSSIGFFGYSKKSLLKYVLINERIQHGSPIPFKLKDRFFFYKDIYSILDCLEPATITNISIKTDRLEKALSSVSDFLSIPELENQILYQLEVRTKNPHVEVSMRETAIEVSFVDSEDNKSMLDEIIIKLSVLLNNTNTPNAWCTFSYGSFFLD